MDALKKADEAKLITSEEPISPTNWEDQLLPEFKQKLATEQNTENSIQNEVVNNENSPPIDWDAQFLPDFAVDKVLPIEEERSEIVPEVNSIPNKLQVITTKPVTQLADTITAPQFTVKPTYSDSVNLNFVEEQVNTETSIESESVYPEDAQAILAAHSYKTPTRTYGLLGLLGVILIGFGAGYYYLDQLVTSSSAVVAIQRRPLLTPPPEQITTLNATQINQTEAVKINQSIEDKEQIVKKSIASIIPVTKAEAQPLKKKTEKSPVAKPKKLPAPPKKTPPPAKKVAAEEYARVQNTPGIHTLQKNAPSPQLNQHVMQAYTAFQSGDDTSAKKIYQTVLQQDQNNRDALLGLAAIAIRQDQPQKAEQYYKQILKQYPQDTNAQLGLISVLGNKAPEYTESQLKQFLDKNPKFAYGYFNLGNYYANLNQWEKAQQAYFEAYQYDEQQINYAYNLAISLDQLNQYAMASVYYQRTLQLSARTPHHELDIHAIQQRLQTLLQSSTSSALTALSTKSLAQD